MATVDIDLEKAKQLHNVQLIVDSLMEIVRRAKIEGEWGAVLKASKELIPYFERHAELLGLNAPPQTQKVELSGDIGHLLKLVQTEEDNARENKSK